MTNYREKILHQASSPQTGMWSARRNSSLPTQNGASQASDASGKVMKTVQGLESTVENARKSRVSGRQQLMKVSI